jgi:hypothetical protein
MRSGQVGGKSQEQARVKIEPDIDKFTESLKRLAELQGKTQREVVLDQGALWCRDAIALHPPFGKTPLKESGPSQNKIGQLATKRDVDRLFRGVGGTLKNTDLEKAWRRLSRKRNTLAAEVALKDFGFKRVAGFVEAATEEKHNAHRNTRGGIRKGSAQWFTWQANKVKQFKLSKSKLVGRAKAGWLTALSAINALRGKSTFRVPAFVARHTNEPGGFTDVGSDDVFGIVCSNNVPFAQKHLPRIEREGWKARMIAAPRQAEHLYKAMVRKAAQLKL